MTLKHIIGWALLGGLAGSFLTVLAIITSWKEALAITLGALIVTKLILVAVWCIT